MPICIVYILKNNFQFCFSYLFSYQIHSVLISTFSLKIITELIYYVSVVWWSEYMFIFLIFCLWGATPSGSMFGPGSCSHSDFPCIYLTPTSLPGSSKWWSSDPQWPVRGTTLYSLLRLRMSGQGNEWGLKSSHASLPKLCTLAWGVYVWRKVTFLSSS